MFTKERTKGDCSPPDCSNTNDGQKLPDPNDCHSFYVCFNDELVDVSISCPDGEIFDNHSGDCVTGTDCENNCQTGQCHFTCEGPFDFVPNKKDCGGFYICIPDAEMLYIPCEVDKPYFNGDVCGTDVDSCCSSLCTALCGSHDVGQLIADPEDCKKFYICMVEGTPPESLHQSCPEGQNFNVDKRVCDSEAQCITSCVNY